MPSSGLGVSVGALSSAVGVAVAAGAWSSVTVQNSTAGALPLTPSVLYPTLATVTPGGTPTALQIVCVCPDLTSLTFVAVHPSNTQRKYEVSVPYVCPSDPMTSKDVSVLTGAIDPSIDDRSLESRPIACRREAWCSGRSPVGGSKILHEGHMRDVIADVDHRQRVPDVPSGRTDRGAQACDGRAGREGWDRTRVRSVRSQPHAAITSAGGADAHGGQRRVRDGRMARR